MKINYLKLVNYSNIYTSFKSKEMSIDFKDCKNKIILLTGPNGSGKTSILSCLHPFATNGNLDVRNDNPLVLIGKEGYKEIHIEDGDNEYVIKHYYTPNKKTHSVKSYIEKNGVELNVNGNVSSFKEYVKDELNIEMDYLKLTRLGSNVTNFIDLKTTERKSFMGKILDEVDIYLKYHKKITSDMREVKSIISHLMDKINKLNITDEDDLKKYQKNLNKQIESYKEEIEKIKSSLSITNYEIEKYDSVLEIKEKLDIKKKELHKIEKVLNKRNGKNLSLEECQTSIDEISRLIDKSEVKLDLLKEKRNHLLNELDDNFKSKNEIDKELNKVSENTEITDTEYMIDSLRKTIDNRNKELDITNYEYKFTKKELSDLIVMLDSSMDILLSTYEFGKNPINKAIEYIKNGYDISDYISSHSKKVTKNKLQSACEYVYKKFNEKYGNIKPKCKDFKGCKLMDFYDDVFDLATSEPDEIVEDEEFVTYAKLSYQNINTVLKNMGNFKSTFEKLPKDIQDMFILKNILNKISKTECIYDKERLYRELSLVTEYELQQEDLNKLQELKDKLSLLKKSTGNVEYFENKRKKIISDMDYLKDDIDTNTDDIKSLSEDIDNLKEEYEDLLVLKDSIEKGDSIRTECNELEESYYTLKDLFIKRKDTEDNLNLLLFQYNKLEKEYNDNEYRLNSYRDMKKELSLYNDKYDDMEFIKRSLSSKEGIPLLYIQIYLKNIPDITNDLLEIIYKDELYIENFNITSDEFSIPFVTKGTQINDVSYASQGEKSFISLALSFALTYQSISRYNIMLLDEIDATLDTRNREKFLQILERQIEMIDGEQIFLISHNNMFNMYPVDIIDTKNKIDTDNKLANYIKIKCK